MISQKEEKTKTTSLITPRMTFMIMPSGDIGSIKYGDHLIGGKAAETEGGLATLYLRMVDDQKTTTANLMGENAPGAWQIRDHTLFYQGNFQGMEYRIKMMAGNGIWFYDVRLHDTGTKNRKAQLYYGHKIIIDPENAASPGLGGEGTRPVFPC
jgi:hypothetical protein